MMRMLQSARMLAPLMVLVLVAPALGPAVAHLCRMEAPAQMPCHGITAMGHVPQTASATEQPPAHPVAKPCCAPAPETVAPAPAVSSVTDQLLAVVSFLPAEASAALRVPPPVPILRDTGPPLPAIRTHLAVSVLLI